MRRRQLLLVGAQAIGQLAMVLVLPVLTRVFTPEEMGGYQAALSLGLLIQPLATLRLEFFLPSTGSADESRRLRRLAIVVMTSFTIVLLVLACVLHVWTDAEPIAEVVMMTAVILFAYGWMAIDNAILLRAKETARLAARNVLSGTLSAGLQVVAGLWLHSIPAIAAAILIGRLIAVAATRGRLAGHDADGPDRRPWTIRRGLVAAASGLVSSASAQTLMLYSSVGFGIRETGQVGVAQRTAVAPLGMVSQGLSQYTQAELAPMVRDHDPELHAELKRQIKLVTPAAVCVVLALAILGPLLAVPVFGQGWEAVGPLLAALSISAGLQLLTAPLLPVFVMLGLEAKLLMLQVLRLVASLIGALVGQLTAGTLLGATLGFSIASALAYGLLLAVLLRATTQGRG